MMYCNTILVCHAHLMNKKIASSQGLRNYFSWPNSYRHFPQVVKNVLLYCGTLYAVVLTL